MVRCGLDYSLVVTNAGNLFVCGNNKAHQLGSELENTKHSSTFIQSSIYSTLDMDD